ncbi:uncharacterized protein EAF02_006901 [Botrytis sinoallii]|uniref:uncharacterized protein n=1 Tax=Botrytis sinoallii TaxID=1463999 RepID=UPI0018FFD5E4|nr:uncharacterized protein EAF02_006901 [Botrytis sinoallii]KAF7881010.1 hypothetical protein EAF02_006901 [Botrytis sinoallii]
MMVTEDEGQTTDIETGVPSFDLLTGSTALVGECRTNEDSPKSIMSNINRLMSKVPSSKRLDHQSPHPHPYLNV